MDFLDNDQKQLIFDLITFILLFIIIGLSLYQGFFKNERACICESTSNELCLNENKDEVTYFDIPKEPAIVHVDIKGAVINPGVYELTDNMMVNDVVNMAGGLKSNASTKYINLSMQVCDQMVIYIYTNYEISLMSSKPKEICNTSNVEIIDCKDSSIVISGNSNSSNNASNTGNTGNNNNDNTNSNEQKKISINNGTKEELMTLSGIGESKALAIIEYRTNNGEFKALEDIMNVSGIGAAAFEKIKDDIEL